MESFDNSSANGELWLDGESLTLEEVAWVARSREVRVRLAPEARKAVADSRALVDRMARGEAPVYGISTGFGRLAEVVIPPEERRLLQRNLVRSHCVGVGAPLSAEEVRAIMLLRANTLARGHSGCRVVVVERLLDLLNAGIHPIIPELGSVGASGDLAPLARMALALMGEGEVEREGEIVPAARALEERGLEALELEEKEGLALINGTQATTAVGILAFLRAEQALETAEVAGAMSLEGLRGTPDPFRPEAHKVRPHWGQAESAGRLWALLQGSEIRESHRHGDPRVQDAYCLRCMPQVHGAARQALAYARKVLETEANSTTDNPLVLPEAGILLSAGNFHAQIVAQALDLVAIALADLAAISERRLERLLNPDLSGHPPFLARRPGLESGLMMVQVAVVDLVAEMRLLAHPASVDSVPTSANQEDHVSMGLLAARKLRRSVACLEYVLAAELLCSAQALELLRPLRAGRGVEEAFLRLRSRIPPLEGDRVLAPDLEKLADMVRSGVFAQVFRNP